MATAYTVASKTARVRRCYSKCMLTPGLPDLLELLSVVSAAAHSVNILRNKRMIAVGKAKPVHIYRPLVASISSQSEPHPAIGGAGLRLHQTSEVAYDHVRARNSPNSRFVDCRQRRPFHIAVLIHVHDLGRLHGCGHGHVADHCAGVRWPAKSSGKLL